ncbi:hypothetical protein CANARDRAFT_6448 [[Candida] arabinofermentans NRRL YB-2248]|uniref:Uncharacterized protein n=1 Tax=[Candida] arabinofermentans NRRL YB-2248 TaxID=983967 RepID=A0A1E4T5D3_9ASCO|nr:hypothetical protein CANARDRAFT_6448 [[Candida] arabinofermentans NRRL YB-2248]
MSSSDHPRGYNNQNSNPRYYKEDSKRIKKFPHGSNSQYNGYPYQSNPSSYSQQASINPFSSRRQESGSAPSTSPNNQQNTTNTQTNHPPQPTAAESYSSYRSNSSQDLSYNSRNGYPPSRRTNSYRGGRNGPPPAGISSGNKPNTANGTSQSVPPNSNGNSYYRSYSSGNAPQSSMNLNSRHNSSEYHERDNFRGVDPPMHGPFGPDSYRSQGPVDEFGNPLLNGRRMSNFNSKDRYNSYEDTYSKRSGDLIGGSNNRGGDLIVNGKQETRYPRGSHRDYRDSYGQPRPTRVSSGGSGVNGSTSISYNSRHHRGEFRTTGDEPEYYSRSASGTQQQQFENSTSQQQQQQPTSGQSSHRQSPYYGHGKRGSVGEVKRDYQYLSESHNKLKSESLSPNHGLASRADEEDLFPAKARALTPDSEINKPAVEETLDLNKAVKETIKTNVDGKVDDESQITTEDKEQATSSEKATIADDIQVKEEKSDKTDIATRSEESKEHISTTQFEQEVTSTEQKVKEKVNVASPFADQVESTHKVETPVVSESTNEKDEKSVEKEQPDSALNTETISRVEESVTSIKDKENTFELSIQTKVNDIDNDTLKVETDSVMTTLPITNEPLETTVLAPEAESDKVKDNLIPIVHDSEESLESEEIKGCIFPMNRVETKYWELKHRPLGVRREKLVYLNKEKVTDLRQYNFFDSSILIFKQAKGPILVKKLLEVQKAINEKQLKLTEEFVSRNHIWQKRTALMDEQLNKFYQADNEKDENNNEPNLDNKGRQIGGKQGSSSRRGRHHGDSVRTEAEFMEILESLEREREKDPMIKAQYGSATIPPMIMDPAEKYGTVRFFDSNNLVLDKLDWANRMKLDPIDTFTEAEHEKFCDAYAMWPKKFGRISNYMGGLRTPEECVLHYYKTKKDTNFKHIVANRNRRTTRKSAANKKKVKESKPSRNGTQTPEVTDSVSAPPTTANESEAEDQNLSEGAKRKNMSESSNDLKKRRILEGVALSQLNEGPQTDKETDSPMPDSQLDPESEAQTDPSSVAVQAKKPKRGRKKQPQSSSGSNSNDGTSAPVFEPSTEQVVSQDTTIKPLQIKEVKLENSHLANNANNQGLHQLQPINITQQDFQNYQNVYQNQLDQQYSNQQKFQQQLQPQQQQPPPPPSSLLPQQQQQQQQQNAQYSEFSQSHPQMLSADELDKKKDKSHKDRAHITSYWSVQEINMFPALLQQFGTDWDNISKQLGSKTSTMVRNFYQRGLSDNATWEQKVREADSRKTDENSTAAYDSTRLPTAVPVQLPTTTIPQFNVPSSATNTDTANSNGAQNTTTTGPPLGYFYERSLGTFAVDSTRELTSQDPALNRPRSTDFANRGHSQYQAPQDSIRQPNVLGLQHTTTQSQLPPLHTYYTAPSTSTNSASAPSNPQLSQPKPTELLSKSPRPEVGLSSNGSSRKPSISSLLGGFTPSAPYQQPYTQPKGPNNVLRMSSLLNNELPSPPTLRENNSQPHLPPSSHIPYVPKPRSNIMNLLNSDDPRPAPLSTHTPYQPQQQQSHLQLTPSFDQSMMRSNPFANLMNPIPMQQATKNQTLQHSPYPQTQYHQPHNQQSQPPTQQSPNPTAGLSALDALAQVAFERK